MNLPARLELAVVDSSAIVAILQTEPAGAAFKAGLARCAQLRMSAATQLERSIIVLARKGPAGLEVLDDLLAS